MSKLIPFVKSKKLSLGVELELQLINPISFDLAIKAKDLIRSIQTSKYNKYIKPEITQGMIEINSDIHTSPQQFFDKTLKTCKFITHSIMDLNAYICGGGSHAFQHWSDQKIFPAHRFRGKFK